MIDYRDNCWFVITASGDFGFWSLASAMSFAINNLNVSPKFTNQAILAKIKNNLK